MRIQDIAEAYGVPVDRLRAALLELATPTPEAAQALEGLGVTQGQGSAGGGGGAGDPGQEEIAQGPVAEVKALPDPYRLEVRGVVWGGRDLTGDAFDLSTDLGRGRPFKGMPVYYDHTLRGLKSQIGQVVAAQEDEEGIVFEVELERRHRYTAEVRRLAEAGALGGSTGSPAHLVARKGGQLKRWIVSELSLTPTPAEPRTEARPAAKHTAEPEAGPQAPTGATGTAAPLIIIVQTRNKDHE
jgi:hypothetical protein